VFHRYRQKNAVFSPRFGITRISAIFGGLLLSDRFAIVVRNSMSSDIQSALRSLRSLFPAEQVITEPVAMMTYEYDASLDRGMPDAVVFPRSVSDVQKLARWSAEFGVPLIARGAGTGLSGGAIAEHGGVIVQFSHMNKLVEFDADGRSAVVQPGLVNLMLDEQAKSRGLYFPPDPSSGRASTLGGNIAENSGGPHCFKYGVTTNYVSGLQVVLPEGDTVRLGGRALDYPEYDLLALLNGSEGTLGIVTEASVRMLRNAPAVKTLMAAFDSIETAGEAVSALIAQGFVPATLEMMDQKMMQIIEQFAHAGLPTEAGAALIVEVDGFKQCVGPQMDEINAILAANGAIDLRLAETEEQRTAIWYGRKSAVGAMSRLAPAYYLVDVTVPRSKLAATLAGVNQICDEMQLRVGYVFHAGDGNLHPLILIENPHDKALVEHVMLAGKRIVEICVAYDGSITGEHGVGIEKREMMPLMYSETELDVMKEIKHLFDPRQLLNPHKIFPRDTKSVIVDPVQAADSVPSAKIYRPNNAAEVGAILRDTLAAGQSLRIRGNGTKSAHLPNADHTLITTGLRGITTFARDDLYVTVNAGTTIAELQAELGRERFWVPLASPWADATVGGVISTNWNAPLRMRYSGLRDQILAATVAMADGRVVRMGRPVVKNVAGYDLPKLLVGAHGTLGLITSLTLKLLPLPRAQRSLVIPVESLDQGLEWGARLRQVCLNASALLLSNDMRFTTLQSHVQPLSLVYTVEGLPEDVEAEFAELQLVLNELGASQASAYDNLTGTGLWSEWIASAANVLRLGAAAKDVNQLVKNVNLQQGQSFIADLASGLVYVGTDADEAAQAAAQRLQGYSVVLRSQQADAVRWPTQPDALGLMKKLRNMWGAEGLLNPKAFVV
jgi:D-lactate dehydrogenase (cytochrome)